MPPFAPFALAIALLAMLAAPAANAGSAAVTSVEPTISIPSTPVPSRQGWTGAYGGVTFGIARSGQRAGIDDAGRTTEPNVAGHVGYNLDLGNWIAGGELAVGRFGQGDGETSWGATTRLRGGPVLGAEGRTWGFGSVGLTHLRDAGTDAEGQDHADGWLIGIGAARLLRDNVILTGEISHTRFGGGSDARSTGASVGVSFRF